MNRPAILVVLLLAACSGRPNLSNDNRDGTPSGTFENTDELCSNELDDDNNGFTDCADLLCQQSAQVTVCRQAREGTQALCHDGQDNDGDGRADCADADCEAHGCFETSDAACANGTD